MAKKKPDDGQIYEQMQFDYGVASTAFEDTVARLTKACDHAKSLTGNKREDFASAGLAELNQARALVPDAIEKIAVARGSARVAAYHVPSVNAHKAEILAAMKKISEWQKTVLKLDTDVHKLFESIVAAQDKLEDLSKHYVDWVKEMTKIIAESEGDQKAMRAALDSTYANAQQHVAKRNVEGLKLDHDDAAKLNLKPLEQNLAKLQALYKKAEDANPKVSMEARQEMMTQYGKARNGVEKLAKDVEYFKERKQAIKSMKVDPAVDAAMKVLKLPAAFKSALAKALKLEGASCIKALHDISQQAKLGQHGKDMYFALRKAKVI